MLTSFKFSLSLLVSTIYELRTERESWTISKKSRSYIVYYIIGTPMKNSCLTAILFPKP